MNILILGAGLSGLTVAANLKGHNVTILEPRSEIGGLCRTFGGGGFLSDIGGHVLFSRDKELLNSIVDPLRPNVELRDRRNMVKYGNNLVPYPLENGMCDLSLGERMALAKDMIGASRAPAADLEKWCYSKFGPTMAEHYLLPYNRKIWKMHPGALSSDWVARIPSPSRFDVAKAALGMRTVGYKHQSKFWYPKEGGIFSLLNSMTKASDRTECLCGAQLKTLQLLPVTRIWEIVYSDCRYPNIATYADAVISTLPIPELLACISYVPSWIQSAADQLVFRGLKVVLLGVKGSGPKHTAIYDSDIYTLAHRTCYNSNFAASMCPPRHWSLSAEITTSSNNPWFDESDDWFTQTVALQNWLKWSDIVYSQVHTEKYAYVVPTLGYQKSLSAVMGYLKHLGIISCGRFAEFRYLNMDECIANARECARKINEGVVE